ncbi:MAG: alkaline phosphatase family protein [Oscillospiraceae bacterium]|nr:alkaline phosphatase family protein [Oscillospiraceae bacterium]
MIKYPDYDRSILSIASSLLKHFGVTDCQHKTLPEFDKLLEKNYKNVIVILLDGLGTSTLNYHLKDTDFLRKHYVTAISSVFPSTTVAATTSILSGFSPLECAWLGWDLYFKEIDETVAVFRNTLQRNGEPAADYNVAEKYIPYKNIMKRIEEVKGKKSAYCVAFFSNRRIKSFEDICKTIYKLSKKRKKKYIYAYWNQPDHAMHGHGVTSKEAHEQILHINREVEKLCGKLKDSLVIITADHGQCDGVTKYLEDYPKLVKLLEMPPSVEPRALSFFVKDGRTEEFKTEFENAFGESFRLMTKDEVFKENLLGFGTPHPKTADFIGDFFAVALDETCIEYKRGDFEMVGVHAGLTEEEMTVPFITIETKRKRCG